MNRAFYEIARCLLDDQWRAVFVAQLGTQTGATAFVFAASRTDEILTADTAPQEDRDA